MPTPSTLFDGRDLHRLRNENWSTAREVGLPAVMSVKWDLG